MDECLHISGPCLDGTQLGQFGLQAWVRGYVGVLGERHGGEMVDTVHDNEQVEGVSGVKRDGEEERERVDERGEERGEERVGSSTRGPRYEVYSELQQWSTLSCVGQVM
jgi:hypothetical protein